MPLKKWLSTKDVISVLYDIDRRLTDMGVQRKLSLYCIGGTKLMLQNKKDASKDMDFIVPYRDNITLGGIMDDIQSQREIIIDRFLNGEMPGYTIPDYQTESREANYNFNHLRVFYLDDTTFIITKIIAGRVRDIEEISPFLKEGFISGPILRKRFSEFELDKNKTKEITKKFEKFIKAYFH